MLTLASLHNRKPWKKNVKGQISLFDGLDMGGGAEVEQEVTSLPPGVEFEERERLALENEVLGM